MWQTLGVRSPWVNRWLFILQIFCEIGMKIKKTDSVCRVPPASLSLDLTDTRACCCCCSNQLGIIIPWGLHEVLGGLRQHLLVVHTSFPPMYYYVQPPPPDTRWYVDEIRLIHCLNLDLSNQNGTKEMCIGVRSYLFDNCNHISQ